MFVGVTAPDFRRTAASISACSIAPACDQPDGFEHAADFRQILRLRRRPAAAGTPARAGPSAPWRPSPESGFVSTKFTSISAEIALLNCARAGEIVRAGRAAPAASSPREFRSTTTEIKPRPPSAISGSVIASSPRKHDETLRHARRARAAICEIFPDASFTPTIFSISARRFTVAGSMFTPVRPGML